MPYSRPQLTDLRNQVLQDINSAQISNSSGTLLVALLQKAVLRVVAYAQAGLSYEHYGYLDWISKQAIPWTAEDEFLEGWAALRGVYRQPAAKTTGSATWTVSSSGLSVPSGAALTRADGAQFVTTAASTTSGSSTTAPIQALIAGAAGNFDANTIFALANPIAGIQANSTASSQTTAGADQEADDSLRTRMLTVYAAPPQGGDRQDYIEWALAVPGVTRAWISPNGMGAGTVNLFFMMDNAEAAHSGFPQGTNGVATNEPRASAATGDQLTVANVIFAQQPVTALVYVTAPTSQPINFTVSSLGSNNTTAMQAAITAALTDMFVRLASVGGTVNPADGSAWPAIDESEWYAALNAIPGLTQYVIGTPSTPIVSNSGALPVLGTITFST